MVMNRCSSTEWSGSGMVVPKKSPKTAVPSLSGALAKGYLVFPSILGRLARIPLELHGPVYIDEGSRVSHALYRGLAHRRCMSQFKWGGGERAYLPVKSGARFSTKCATPSLKSSDLRLSSMARSEETVASSSV